MLAALAAGTAQGAELSVTDRLQDRREVAAGTRAQVLGFEDGRFYANGWHITGEMGGIFTPPLKLLDSVYFGVNDQWVGPATKFTSGWGYVRYDLPSIDGVGLRRTDVAPDGRRGALLGLELTNPKKNSKRVNVMVDAHSELMTQYPWGFGGTTPNANDNADDSGSLEGGRLVFRDTGKLPGEAANHSYTAIVGSNRTPVDGETGPGHYGPFGAGRVCTDTAPRRRCRASATTARSATALAGSCTTRSTSPATGRRRSGSPSPARRTRRPRRAASSPRSRPTPLPSWRRSAPIARRCRAGPGSSCRATSSWRSRSTGASRTWPT